MMNIYSWNVNGIRSVNKDNRFNNFLKSYNPDIICLQEIKAKEHQIETIPSDYFVYFNPAQKPGYSGTAIYSKKKPLQVTNNLPGDLALKYHLADDTYGDLNQEGRVITAQYKKFYLVTVYTPNAKDDLSRLELRHKLWDPAFFEYIKQLEEKLPVIFCGDLNVAHTENDLANPTPNKGKKGFTLEERSGIDRFIENGFIDTFRKFKQGNGYYTWWSYFANSRLRNVGWRIDYFIISKALQNNLKSAQIHPDILGSDHCPISISIDV
jgi:exodeoxyribonuclease-3